MLTPILDKESPEFIAYCEEIDAEKMRQLYVAMTRAKYRLYIPAIELNNPIACDFGAASPLEIFLAKLEQPSVNYCEIYQQIETGNTRNLINFITKHENSHSLSYTELSEITFELTQTILDNTTLLVEPKHNFNTVEKSYIHSYTQLQRTLSKKIVDQEHFTPMDNTTNILPLGAKTGIFFHKILENIPFAITRNIASETDLIPLIADYLKNSEFASHQATIAKIIFNTFKAKLQTETTSFCLEDVDYLKTFHEIEFLYPSTNLTLISGFQLSNGFLKGVIDLIFEFDNKYYILDWKTNWLGNDCHSYSHENLGQAMSDHDYFLQAKIYTFALQKYLKITRAETFDEIFGGIFYLFVRGTLTSSSQGVYFYKPDILSYEVSR